MNISGVLIFVSLKSQANVERSLSKIPGLEIHHKLSDGRIVAVLEEESTQSEVDTIRKLNEIDGVISANMVYHNFEEETLPDGSENS